MVGHRAAALNTRISIQTSDGQQGATAKKTFSCHLTVAGSNHITHNGWLAGWHSNKLLTAL